MTNEDAPGTTAPRALSLAAAFSPAAGSIVALVVLLGATDLAGAIDASGWVGLLLFGLSIAASVVSGILVSFAARGSAIPSVIALGCAALPWLAGAAGLRWSVRDVVERALDADVASLTNTAARGLSEALWCRVLGASLAAGTIGGTALGLAIAALAHRAPRRVPAMALLGVVLGGLVLAATWGGVLSGEATPGSGDVLPWTLGVLGAIPTLAFACAAIGDDARGRSGALAAAAAVGVAGALVAATIAAESAITAVGLVESVTSPEEGRVPSLARAAAAVDAACHARTLGVSVTLVAVLATAGWSVARRRPSLGALLGAAVLGSGALAMFALDAFAASASSASVRATTHTWWLDRDDVRPVAIFAYAEAPRSADLVLRADGAVAWDGRAVAATPDALEAVVRAALARPQPPPAPVEEDAYQLPSYVYPEHAAYVQVEPPIVVVPDASAGASAWRALIGAALRAGARSMVLEGVQTSADEASWRTVRALLARPFFGAAVPHRTRRCVVLESALPDGLAERDEVLWHATVDASGEVSLRPRAGQDARRERRREEAAYLSIGDGATSASITRALDALDNGGDFVLVPGAVPGHPERSVAR